MFPNIEAVHKVFKQKKWLS